METQPTPHVKPVAVLIDHPGFYPHATIATETHQSYPIPVRSPTGLQLLFLYCTSTLQPGVGMWLTPPDHEARVDPVTGTLIALRHVRAEDFGQRVPPDNTIGRYNMIRAVRAEDWSATNARLLQAYDTLLPAFAAGRAPQSPGERDAAVAFHDIFPRITEEGLQPYYRSAGREFFDWVDRAAVSR